MGKIDDPSKIKGAVTVQPIPSLRNQVGPTCGLYALSIVAHFWNDLASKKGISQPWTVKPEVGLAGALSAREKLNKEIQDRGGKTGGKPANIKVQPAPSGNMLEIAQSLGSRVGEVFDAEALAMIARQSGLQAFVLRWKEPTQMFEIVKTHIDQNMPCIVAYDNTDTGDPGEGNHGARAHWSVLFGYVDAKPAQLLAMHGWGKYYSWDPGALERSNSQMDQFGTWGTWYKTKGVKADPKNNIKADPNKIGWAGPQIGRPNLPSPRDLKVAPTAIPTAIPHDMPRPDNAIAAFQISHELDLKHQIVIVTPKDRDFDSTPPKTKSTTGFQAPKSFGDFF